MTEDVCDVREIHGDRVDHAKAAMPAPETVESLSDFFKVFGDPTRVRILLALDSGEMCVCDISEVLRMSMSATSHQLRMLRDAHLVSNRKVGKSVYYSLCDDHVRIVLETALEHVGEEDRGRTAKSAEPVPAPSRPASAVSPATNSAASPTPYIRRGRYTT